MELLSIQDAKPRGDCSIKLISSVSPDAITRWSNAQSVELRLCATQCDRGRRDWVLPIVLSNLELLGGYREASDYQLSSLKERWALVGVSMCHACLM
jgi:hypothetical protein